MPPVTVISPGSIQFTALQQVFFASLCRISSYSNSAFYSDKLVKESLYEFLELYSYTAYFSSGLWPVDTSSPSVTKLQSVSPQLSKSTTLFWLYLSTCRSRWCPDCAQVQSWNNCQSHLLHFLSVMDHSPTLCAIQCLIVVLLHLSFSLFFITLGANSRTGCFVMAKGRNPCIILAHQICYPVFHVNFNKIAV